MNNINDVNNADQVKISFSPFDRLPPSLGDEADIIKKASFFLAIVLLEKQTNEACLTREGPIFDRLQAELSNYKTQGTALTALNSQIKAIEDKMKAGKATEDDRSNLIKLESQQQTLESEQSQVQGKMKAEMQEYITPIENAKTASANEGISIIDVMHQMNDTSLKILENTQQ